MSNSVISGYCLGPWKKSTLTVLLVLIVLYAVIQIKESNIISQLLPVVNDRAVTEREFEGTADDDPELVEYVKCKKLFPPSPHPYNLENPNTVDNSQFGQTPDLSKILHNMTGGFFVEVGAFDGEEFSNTLYFERFRNWTGLLIEPDPKNFRNVLKKNRKAYAIQAGLSLTPAAEIVRFKPGGSMGRINQKGKFWDVTLQCFPLYTLMLALGRSQIDLFSLDIEGDELKVLKTIPWDKMQIRLMVVEVAHIKEGKEEVIRYMESVGYTFVKELKVDMVFANQDLLDQAGR